MDLVYGNRAAAPNENGRGQLWIGCEPIASPFAAKAGVPFNFFIHRKEMGSSWLIEGPLLPRYATGMSVLSDRWIREAALAHAMIEPFVEAQRADGCISYGLSSYGYDARVADEFKIFTNVDSAIVDPKNFDSNSFVDRKTDVCIIPPNSFALARTVEYFRVPRDVLVICLGKSTYARCGIIVNVTPLEPGWEGHVTLEFSNTTPLPAKVYANEGACQFLFLQGNEPCEVSYADRAGKYMGQRGVTLPKL